MRKCLVSSLLKSTLFLKQAHHWKKLALRFQDNRIRNMRTKTLVWLTPLVIASGAVFAYLHHGSSTHLKSHEPSRQTASDVTQPALEQGEQWDSSNEDQTREIIAINERMLIERAKNDSYLYRDAHPKTHGCAKASFDVDSSKLPADLRVGVFAPEMGSHFPAWIRFSNGNPDGEHDPDIKKDVRGMAIKLMGIAGSSSGSQDFVMLTSKEFFSENADDYTALHDGLSGGTASTFWYLGTHWKQAEILLGAQIKAANPLQVDYFSAVPYKLGERSMKFKAIPCATNSFHDELPSDDASPNFLRERLVSTLQSNSACYEFWVQPNMDPEKNIIENPMIAWDESVSPYIKVATLKIPQQKDIDSTEHLNFCENLSFTPWHSLAETRPMGEINRMRLKIYSAISEVRHRVNHIPQIEPRSHDICQGETAPLCQTPHY